MREFKISEQFIKEAHAASNVYFQEKLENEFPEVFPKITYKIGQMFMYDYETYILACVDTHRRCCLICITGGDKGIRWSDGVNIADSRKITQEEFDEICGMSKGKFKLKE